MKRNRIKNSSLALLLLTLLCGQAHSSTQVSQLETDVNESRNQQQFWGQWKLSVGGHNYAHQTDSAAYAGLGLGLKGGVSLLENLDFSGELSLVAKSGFSQERFGRDSLNDGINVREAIISYAPIEQFQFDAGIISQCHICSSLLVSNRSFPGVKQTIQNNFSDLRVGVRAQQTIPTSRSLSAETRNEKEKTPTFLTESVFAEYEPSQRFIISAQATQFRFNNLPTNVAHTSRLLGNTVPHSAPSNSEFLFEYEGYLYDFQVKSMFTQDLGILVHAQLLENKKAPSAFNTGYMLETSALFKAFGQDLKAGIVRFFNESDSSPAYYNSSAIGHNNREGYSIDLQAIISNNIKLRAQYTDSDVINSNLVQSRMQYVTFALETIYADF